MSAAIADGQDEPKAPAGLTSLRDSLKKDINRFDAESTKHKRLHRRCQTTAIALTAITTIVAGVGLVLPDSGKAVQFAVLCLTAVTAATVSWTEMRRTRELWQHEREVYYALIDIQREMEFVAASKDMTQAVADEFFQRIAAVLSSSSKGWTVIQQNRNRDLSSVARAG
jgi:uncharacterized membrane protein